MDYVTFVTLKVELSSK